MQYKTNPAYIGQILMMQLLLLFSAVMPDLMSLMCDIYDNVFNINVINSFKDHISESEMLISRTSL